MPCRTCAHLIHPGVDCCLFTTGRCIRLTQVCEKGADHFLGVASAYHPSVPDVEATPTTWRIKLSSMKLRLNMIAVAEKKKTFPNGLKMLFLTLLGKFVFFFLSKNREQKIHFWTRCFPKIIPQQLHLMGGNLIWLYCFLYFKFGFWKYNYTNKVIMVSLTHLAPEKEKLIQFLQPIHRSMIHFKMDNRNSSAFIFLVN